ncbi:MAG: CHASE2 domain-containing protein [Bacteroidales bacterium]|nr:CHASE2 domain-containing protein [Bacteroidales bacterium]
MENTRNSGAFIQDNLVVISCHEENDRDSLVRERIARVIDKASSFSPAVIGLDIRFKGRHNVEEDDFLEEVVSRNRDRLVLARFLEDEENRSFFDTDENNLQFGYTNIGDFYFNPSNKEPSFAEVILSEAGMLDSSFIPEHKILDFSSLGALESYDADTFLNLSAEDTEIAVYDKIVLIGDMEDEKDIVQLPFRVNGKDWMPGMEYHVYCINSMRKDGPNFRNSILANLIFSIVLTFVYSLIVGALTTYVNTRKDSVDKRKYRVLVFLKPIVLSIIWALIPFLMIRFVPLWMRLAPNLVLAMISVSLILFFENFINEIKEN